MSIDGMDHENIPAPIEEKLDEISAGVTELEQLLIGHGYIQGSAAFQVAADEIREGLQDHFEDTGGNI